MFFSFFRKISIESSLWNSSAFFKGLLIKSVFSKLIKDLFKEISFFLSLFAGNSLFCCQKNLVIAEKLLNFVRF